MEHGQVDAPIPSHIVRWFPEFLELGRKRLKNLAEAVELYQILGTT